MDVGVRVGDAASVPGKDPTLLHANSARTPTNGTMSCSTRMASPPSTMRICALLVFRNRSGPGQTSKRVEIAQQGLGCR